MTENSNTEIPYIFPNASMHNNRQIDNHLARRSEVKSILDAIEKNPKSWVCIDSCYGPKEKRLNVIKNDIDEKFGLNYIEFKNKDNSLFCMKISNIVIVRLAGLDDKKLKYFNNFLELLYSDFDCNIDGFNTYFLTKVYAGLRISPNELEKQIDKFFTYKINYEEVKEGQKKDAEFCRKFEIYKTKIYSYLKKNEYLSTQI